METIHEVAIEGVDGVGKSSVAQALASAVKVYERPRVCNPYHTARRINGGDDIYPLWSTREGAHKAIDLLKAALSEERDAAMEEGANLIIYDRCWMTAFTEIGDDAELVAHWGDDMPQTALLIGQPHIREADSDAWDQPEERERYTRLYQEIAWKHVPRMVGVYLMDPHYMDWSVQAVANQIDSDRRYRR